MNEAPFIARAHHPTIRKTVLIGAFIVAVCLWFGFAPSRVQYYPPILYQVPGAIGALFSGVVTYGWARVFWYPEPLIAIDADGITWRKWSDRPIPWHAITRAKAYGEHGFVVLWLDDEARAGGCQPARSFALVSHWLGQGDIALHTQGTARSFEDMLAAARHYAPHLFEDEL